MTRVDGHAPNAAPPANGAGGGLRTVFDLTKAVETARAEAGGQIDIPFTCGGQEFSAPVMDEWDEQVTELLAAGQFAAALSLVLGPDEYRRLRAAAGGSIRLGMLKALFDHLATESGMGGVGEVSASGVSLRTTTRR